MVRINRCRVLSDGPLGRLHGSILIMKKKQIPALFPIIVQKLWHVPRHELMVCVT